MTYYVRYASYCTRRREKMIKEKEEVGDDVQEERNGVENGEKKKTIKVGN